MKQPVDSFDNTNPNFLQLVNSSYSLLNLVKASEALEESKKN